MYGVKLGGRWIEGASQFPLLAQALCLAQPCRLGSWPCLPKPEQLCRARWLHSFQTVLELPCLVQADAISQMRFGLKLRSSFVYLAMGSDLA